MAALALVASAATLAGCSTSTDQGSSDPRSIVLDSAKQLDAVGATENADALRDGEASEEDYYDAARRYQSCMRATGIELGGPVLSPVDNVWLEWTIPDQLPQGDGIGAAVDACTNAWLPAVSAYQATHEPVMDPGLRAAVGDCMTKLDHAVSGDETKVADFLEVKDPASQQRIDLEQCVTTNAERLFPDLPGVTFSY